MESRFSALKARVTAWLQAMRDRLQQKKSASSDSDNIQLDTAELAKQRRRRWRTANRICRRAWRGVKQLGSVVLVSFLSFVLFFCVTGSICAIACTAYVIHYMEDTSTVSIQELTMSYATNIYATDANGELVTLYSVANAVERKPVEFEQVPQHVRYAFVYGEDERFYSHEGVDYKRTLASFANMILHFWDSEQGGSTITQQLVKNLTGDNETSPQRKIREIFRAMQLEKSYTKDEILETYMNYVGFGGASNGIQMAAEKYFGKNVEDLTVAEGACLAAIPQSPEVNNPFAGYYKKAYNEVTGTYYVTDEWVNTGRETNRKRMEYILFQMYDNGAISFDTYQEALAEELIFTDSEEYKALHPELDEEDEEDKVTVTSWVVDTTLREMADYLMEERGVSYDRAMTLIRTGGYQIYTTVDLEMQAYVEQKYSDLDNLLAKMTNKGRTIYYRDLDGDGVKTDEEAMNLQSGFTAIDYSGNILCTVGAIGEKQASLCTSYANTEPQQPGSAIKPVSTYGYALTNDLITWGTRVLDYPPLKYNGKLWPTNYSESSNVVRYSNTYINIYKALEQSYNTIPALLCKTYTPSNVYAYATTTVGLELNDEHDVDYAPLSVGALSYGVTVQDLVNAYMVYGNGGYFSDAHIIARVESADGNLIYAGGDDYAQAIDAETSYVMNKLLQNVVQNGTGKRAKLYSNGEQIPVGGKTGTTSDWFDLMFVGLNPQFVSGVWIGYPENKEIRGHGSMASAQIWNNIIGDWIEEHYEGEDFPTCETIVTGRVCTQTGKIAGDSCPKGAVGYWKSTNAPLCDNVSSQLGTQGTTDEDE